MGRAHNKELVALAHERRFDALLGTRRGLSPDAIANRDNAEAEAVETLLYQQNPGARRVEQVIPRTEPEHPVLICHRDPEYEDSILVDADELYVVDVDIGRSFDDLDTIVEKLGKEEAADWVQGMAKQVINLKDDSKVRAAMYALLDQTGVAYPTTSTGLVPNGIPVLIVRDPDSANEYTTDGEVDIINIDIDGRKVEAMSARAYEAWADEYWRPVAHLDPDHPQRLALLNLLGDLRGL